LGRFCRVSTVIILGALAAQSAFGLSTDTMSKSDLSETSVILPASIDPPTMTFERLCPPPESDLVKWAQDASSNAMAVSNQIALSKEQETSIQQLVSIFENSTPKFQYASISELKDDKGLNVGRVGFNSRAGALQLLVRQYLSLHRHATTPAQIEMKKYLPCLNEIKNTGKFQCLYPGVDFTDLGAKARRNALKNLDFGKAWKDACKDPAMRDLQDRFVDEHYFSPSAHIASEARLRTAIARAFIYDSVVQGGEKGTANLVAKTRKIYAETHAGRVSPTKETEEIEWLKIFSLQRMRFLAHGKVDTRSRVKALIQLLNSGNMDLHFPIQFRYYGAFTLTSDTLPSAPSQSSAR